MPLNPKYTMKKGYAFEFSGKGTYQYSSSEEWPHAVYDPKGDEEPLGQKTIDGVQMMVFKCADGKYRAQTMSIVVNKVPAK